jgi:SAM-dependent methyltransferase
MPAGAWTTPEARWADRQTLSNRYYRDLISDPATARAAFAADFGGFRHQLARCGGNVLDVGGGNGLSRAYLPPSVRYVSLDPDPGWLTPAWLAIASTFPVLSRPLDFVQGVAERLPFHEAVFDAVLTIFSLNHCADPRAAIREIARVLRPGGRWLLVLEDVEPAWSDVLRGGYGDWRGWSAGRVAFEKIRGQFLGWPLEPDHVRITEPEVTGWIDGAFQAQSRTWAGSYLVMEIDRARAT